MEILTQLSQCLLDGDDQEAAQLTARAIEQGIEPKRILDDGLVAGMTEVGKLFKAHDVFLPEVLLAARAMQAGLDLLKPLLADTDVASIGTVVIGTVQGDLHDIGKNLVGIMLKGAGFEVIDLGNDVAPERFVQAAQEQAARKKAAPVIGMSALLTTTMPMMKKVVDLLKEQGLESRIGTIVGGAPVTADFAREIGADAHGFDAVSAVERIKALVSRS